VTVDSVPDPEEEPTPDLTDFSAAEQEILARVGSVMRRIRFGTVQLVVQDGKVVQIDLAEKFRLR
jgi:hypothetical protein